MMPGYSPATGDTSHDPDAAKKALASSIYAEDIPPIVVNAAGYAADDSPYLTALIDMWSETLDVEKIVGKAEEILGEIPKPDELRREVEKIEEAMVKETEESMRVGETLKEKALIDEKSDIHIFKKEDAEEDTSTEPSEDRPQE